MTENHWTHFRDAGIVGNPTAMDTSKSSPLHLWLWEPCGRRGRKVVRDRIPGNMLGEQSFLEKVVQTRLDQINGHINVEG